jgi:hypothetical protein
MPVIGDTIRELWLYLDQADAPLGGMTSPADVELKLFVDTGSGFALSADAISWAAVSGQTGQYNITYTPSVSGVYRLQLRELNVNSQGVRWSFPQEVAAAGAVFLPAFANAFCAETDVERWTQLDFDATSKPTTTQVAAFAQARSSEIRSVVASEGWSPVPGQLTPLSVEEDILRECAAVGAAADAFLAKFMDVDPSQTEKAVALLQEYQRRLQRLVAYAQDIASSSAGYIATPMTTGEMTLRDETQITDGGLSLAISMDQEF